MNSLACSLEAVLFYAAEPMTRARLATILSVSEEEVDDAAASLAGSLAESGIRMLHVNDMYELVTAPEASEAVSALRKEVLSRDLGKAGAETLSVVLYRGPLTRAQIEQIRGLNCAYVLRTLLIRGLIEKLPDPNNSRILVYRPTSLLLRHLGVSAVEELPEYATIRAELLSFEAGVSSPEDATNKSNIPLDTV